MSMTKEERQILINHMERARLKAQFSIDLLKEKLAEFEKISKRFKALTQNRR